MQYLNGTYTLWLNVRHRWDGPVEGEEHLRVLIAYIHLNPLRALFVRRLSDEAWTSHRAYVGKEPVAGWMNAWLRREGI